MAASSEIESQRSPATADSSSASSSTAADPINSCSGDYGYDVFINHRGPDTKKTFASHLYRCLLSHGFRPFLDHRELQEGLNFPSQIEGAIQSASVHVAIFSPKYADSDWCLRELLLMLESRAHIIPVFYHVQPADLRWTGEEKTGVYAKALHGLQMKTTHCSQTNQPKPRYDPDTIQKWRHALSRVADISGFDLDGKFNGDEGQMMENIVERVVKMVKKTPLYVAQYPTGLDGKVKDFETTVLSTHQLTGNVQMVGIVGFGGVGKTTLAKEFFNRKRSEYNKSCFLWDVRESAKNSLHSLQRNLLKDLNLLNGRPIDDIHEGTEMLRKSLSSSQVFLILDDIDHQDQVVGLLPDRDGLRSDSLIVITSRDKGVLARSGVEESSIYELKGLDTTHSQELFCSYAFCQPYPLPEFEDLVKEFLRACDGLPLSLKVFGALLSGEKNKSHWKDILDRVHEVPNDIVDRLRISYDALSPQEQEIFLDIACFFIGKDKNTAITVWDSSGWKGSLGFRNLQGKCLVEVHSENVKYMHKHENVIHMHDHLRDLGRDIAKDKLPRRLWHNTENIDDWLVQQSSVISETRGITMHSYDTDIISSPMLSWYQKIDKVFGNRVMNILNTLYRYLGIRRLMKLLYTCYRFLGVGNRMKKLLHTCYHFLGISAMKLQLRSTEGHLLERILRKVHSPNLIWLSWRDCPYSYLPSWIPMKNLRVLRVQGRLLETLWQGESQAPLQLQELEIIDAVHLSNIPKSMGQMKHLERIIILSSSLAKLPQEITDLKLLRVLVLKRCPMKSLPDSFGNLANLEHMDLYECKNFKRLPDSFGNLANLERLELSGCKNLDRLPDSFGNLAKLQHIDLSRCSNMEWLPDSFGNLANLEQLNLKGCNQLESLPDSFGNLANLQRMDLYLNSKLERLPNSFGNLANLQHLELKWCEKLESLPNSFGKLANLEQLNLYECEQLESLPDSFGNLANLQHLELNGCGQLESLPDSFGNLANLQHLELKRCKQLESLPDSFGNFANLEHLNLNGCEQLESLPDSFGNLANLEHLDLNECKQLERLPGSFWHLRRLNSFNASSCANLTISSNTLGNIRTLEHIDLSGCEKIEVWPLQLALQRSLKTLALTGTKFKELPLALEVLRGMEVLQIGSPFVDTILPFLGDLRNLKELTLKDCRELKHLPASVGELRNLKELTLKDCRELKHLPASVGLLTQLISLEVVDCPEMELPFKMVKGERETVGTLKSDSSINHKYLFQLQRLKLQDTETSEVSFGEDVCPNLLNLSLKECSNLAEVGTLPSTLTRVILYNCCNLRKIGGLCGLANLRSLHIENCGELEELLTIGIKSLVQLQVLGCVKLKSIRDLAQLTKLQSLYVDGCDELEELEGVEYCKSLEYLTIDRCPKLQLGKGVVKRLLNKNICLSGSPFAMGE